MSVIRIKDKFYDILEVEADKSVPGRYTVSVVSAHAGRRSVSVEEQALAEMCRELIRRIEGPANEVQAYEAKTAEQMAQALADAGPDDPQVREAYGFEGGLLRTDAERTELEHQRVIALERDVARLEHEARELRTRVTRTEQLAERNVDVLHERNDGLESRLRKVEKVTL